MSRLLGQVESESGGPIVLTVLSNAEPNLNPFAGLLFEEQDAPDGSAAGNLIALLGPGQVHRWHRWPDHAVLLSPSACEILDRPDTTTANAVARLAAAGGCLLLADSLFLHDPERDLFAQQPLEPHEERRPAAWAALSERLDDWLRNDSGPDDDLAAYAEPGRPVTLHVTHSWGGGVAQWRSIVDRSSSRNTARGTARQK